MRFALLVATVALSASSMAWADSAPAAKPAASKKLAKPISYDGITIEGKREVPIAFVKVRDNSIRNQLDSSIDQHVMDAAQLR